MKLQMKREALQKLNRVATNRRAFWDKSDDESGVLGQ